MASDLLFELKSLLEPEVPPYPPLHEVALLLQNFSKAVKEGGPEVRQEVIDQEAYETIVNTWTMFCETGEPEVRDLSAEAELVRVSTLGALYSITAGFPDIVDPRGFVMITQAIDTRVPVDTQMMALRVIRNICVKNEQNRDILAAFFDLIPPLVVILRQNSPSSEFVHEWCSAMKSLLLADDKRVAYNRSAERKRILFEQQALRYLSQLLNEFPDDTPTLNAIVVLLGSMACRENYCISMEAGGVLPGIVHILTKKHSNPLLAKHTLSLLRFINVSEVVREKVCSYGLMEHVLRVAYLYRNGADMLEIAMSCCAFMTLRCPCHVAQFLKEDGVERVMEIINNHMDHLPVLKGVCFVLRNVAVHGSKQGKTAICEADGEFIIRQIEDKYPEIKYTYTKPVLRDIGAPVSPTSDLARAVSQALMDFSAGRPSREEPEANQERASTARMEHFQNECRGGEEQPKPVKINRSSSEGRSGSGSSSGGEGHTVSSVNETPRSSFLGDALANEDPKSPRGSRSGSKGVNQATPRRSVTLRSPRHSDGNSNVPNNIPRPSTDSPRHSFSSNNTEQTLKIDSKEKNPSSIRSGGSQAEGQIPDTNSTPRNSK